MHDQGTIPLLHDAAHGVNSTVAKVSPQHLPHQLEKQRIAQEKRPSGEQMIRRGHYDLYCFKSEPSGKRQVCVSVLFSNLPARFTKLLNVDCTTECNNEDCERVRGQAVITHDGIEYL